MAEISKHDIARLIKLGATETLQDGKLGLRVVAHYLSAPDTRDRDIWAKKMESWQRALATDVAKLGAKTIDGTLSVTGQSVELVVPLDTLRDAIKHMEDQGLSVKLQFDRQIDPDY